MCRLPKTLVLACTLSALAAAPAAAYHDAPWSQDGGWEQPPADIVPGDEAAWPDEDELPPEAWDDDDAGWPPRVPGPAPSVPEEGPEQPQLPLVTGRTVAGEVARLRADGRAAVPRGAPKRVRRVVAAANEIVGKPYKPGGGHGTLVDRGYDCSGAVGYALIRGAGLMRTTMVSGAMARWGAAGEGRWLTVYANRGHVYLEVAGLRLDTGAYGDPARGHGVRWRPVIGRRPGFHARHPVGL